MKSFRLIDMKISACFLGVLGPWRVSIGVLPFLPVIFLLTPHTKSTIYILMFASSNEGVRNDVSGASVQDDAAEQLGAGAQQSPGVHV